MGDPTRGIKPPTTELLGVIGTRKPLHHGKVVAQGGDKENQTAKSGTSPAGQTKKGIASRSRVRSGGGLDLTPGVRSLRSVGETFCR